MLTKGRIIFVLTFALAPLFVSAGTKSEERKAMHEKQKAERQTYHQQQKQENKEFRESLKNAAIKDHHKKQYNENKTFNAEMHQKTWNS